MGGGDGGQELADRGQRRRILQLRSWLSVQVDGRPDPRGFCTGLVAFKIDRGYREDVPLDDLAVVATFCSCARSITVKVSCSRPSTSARPRPQRDALFYILSGEDQPVGTMFQIFSGLCETVLITSWRERPLGRRAHPQCRVAGEPRRPVRAALWANGVTDVFRISVLRYMKTYGLIHEQLAMALGRAA